MNFLLVQKLEYLERHLGNLGIIENIDPFLIDCNSIVQIQNAGGIIAKHIGLNDVAFNISIRPQPKNVAGHICLNNDSSPVVNIEVDSNLIDKPEMILAVLAHEICHKYLHTHNLHLSGYDNEILTDLTTIYLGLGKLSLNGCEYSITNNILGAVNESKTVTTIKNVGYLSKFQFAQIFRLLCEVRRIPPNLYTRGLNSSAIQALNSVESEDGFFYNTNLFNKDPVMESLNQFVEDELFREQKRFASINRLNRILQQNFQKELEKKEKEFHIYIRNTLREIKDSISVDYRNERLEYLNNLLILDSIRSFKIKISNDFKINEDTKTLYRQIEKTWEENNLTIDNNSLKYFSCPICEKRLRVKEEKIDKIKCPKCEFVFIINTKPFEKLNVESDSVKKKPRLSLINKLLNTIKKAIAFK